jgi:hypothetical protein
MSEIADPTPKSKLCVHDADGNRTRQDVGVPGSTTWLGAAMFGGTAPVIAAHQRLLLRGDPVAGLFRWQSERPDRGTPIVSHAAGARRIVFRGTTSSTFFVGEP